VEAIIPVLKSCNQFFRIAALFVFPVALVAHDIPNDVTAQLFLKPEGQQLNVLVRVPLKSIRDVVFPQRGNGYLDLEHAAPMLPELATLWISDFIELYEGTEALPKRPRVMAARATLESDRSFVAYKTAVAHLMAPPLANSVDVAWNQTLLDVWFAYPIRNEGSRFSIHSELAGWVFVWSRSFGSNCPAVQSAPSNSRATPGWCGWIRDGTRRRCVSSRWASSIFWMVPTTYCSFCA